MEAIFRAMNIKVAERANAQPRLPNWANGFPYVNGGLFSGATCVPRFTRMARTYLNLRHAHERNDEVLERIYIGRRFKNDTERLEKLFELYTKMTAAAKAKPALRTTRVKKA